jgi:hypothetical protein
MQVTKIISSLSLSDRKPVSEATARISIFDTAALQQKLSTNLNWGLRVQYNSTFTYGST